MARKTIIKLRIAKRKTTNPGGAKFTEEFLRKRELTKFGKGRVQPKSGKTPAELASIGGTVTGELARGAKLLSKAYKQELAYDKNNKPEPKTVAEQIARALAEAAAGANENRFGEIVVEVGAARELREPTEGKLSEKHELTGADGKPLSSLPPIINIKVREAK